MAGARALGLGERLALERIRNAVRGNRDAADRAFALQCAEPFAHFGGGQAEPAFAQNIDRDEIAVLRFALGARRDQQLPVEVLLVDRHEPAAAHGCGAENAEDQHFRARHELDDAARIGRVAGLGVTDAIGTHQRAIADAGRRHPRAGLSRNMESDFRGRAVVLRVPFDRDGDEFAVACRGR